jgi:MYXO-CTERM domain-containing protein
MRSADGFLGVIRNEDYVVTGVTQTPAIPPLAALALLLALFLWAWRREGR